VNLYRRGAWKLQPFKDCPAMYTNTPPCWFHRFMLKVLLGWSWEKE
jgi:hypothetical protein